MVVQVDAVEHLQEDFRVVIAFHVFRALLVVSCQWLALRSLSGPTLFLLPPHQGDFTGGLGGCEISRSYRITEHPSNGAAAVTLGVPSCRPLRAA